MAVKFTRRSLIGSAGALVAAGAFPGRAFAQTSGLIKLGALVPLSGGGGAIGPLLLSTQQLVVNEVNAAGGVLGREIRLISEDDQTNAENSLRAARKLIDVDGVIALLGVWSSPVCAAVLPLCWESKTMMIGLGASDSLADLPHKGYFVRTQPSTGMQAAQFAKFAIAENVKHLYIMLPQTPFTADIIRTISGLCAKSNIKVSSTIYDPKKTSLRSEVDDMMRAAPDMLMGGGYQPDMTVLAKDVYRADFKGRFVGFSYAINNKFIEGTGVQVAEGIYALETVPDVGSGAYARLQGLLKQDHVDTTPCHGYDEANLAILSIAAAKDASGTGIRDYIRKIGDPDGVKVDNAIDGIKLLAAGKTINYLGAFGPCKFLPNGDLQSCNFRFSTIHNGKLTPYKTV